MINSDVEMDKHLFVSTLIIYFVLAVILHCTDDNAIGFTLCMTPYSDRPAIAVERVKTEKNSAKLKPVTTTGNPNTAVWSPLILNK